MASKPKNFRDWMQNIALLRPLRGFFGRRLTGTVALLHDWIAAGFRDAVRSPWIGDTVGPAYDALRPAGHELSLPRYPNETWAQYAGRLDRAWTDWPKAGDETSIVEQLAAAGFPGAIVKGPLEWPGRPPIGYWSQFWVFFPAGTHTVTAQGPTIGTFTVGDGTIIGPVGITIEDLRTIRAIIRKFKPAHYICRGIIFEISGWTVGSGHTIGEVGLVIGGSQAIVGA